jgi:hypothetical protein
MSKSRKYRIKSPTMAILSSGGERTWVTVPAGEILSISEAHREGDRLIDVVWNGASYIMFAQDLRERGERADQDYPDPA